MRNALIAGAALCLLAVPARAQDVVICPNCQQETSSWAQHAGQMAEWVKELADWEREIAVSIETFESVSGLTQVMQLASQLNTLTYQNPLMQMGNTIGVVSGMGGGNGELGGQINALIVQNNLLIPTQYGSAIPLFTALNMIEGQRLSGLTGIQAISSELLTRTHIILSGLLTLQYDIDTMANVQHQTGMTARMASIAANVASQQYELQQLVAYSQAQTQIMQGREMQATQCAAWHWYNNTQPLAGGGLTISNPGTNCLGAATVISTTTTTTISTTPPFGAGGFTTSELDLEPTSEEVTNVADNDSNPPWRTTMLGSLLVATLRWKQKS